MCYISKAIDQNIIIFHSLLIVGTIVKSANAGWLLSGHMADTYTPLAKANYTEKGNGKPGNQL